MDLPNLEPADPPAGIRAMPGWGWVLGALAILGGVTVLHLADPRTVPFYPKCVFLQTTGLFCSGCGSTRLLHGVARGDLVGAFRANPLLFGFAVYFLYEVVARCLRARSRVRLPLPRWTARQILILAGVLVGYTVLRNLPWPPFSWLVPV